MTPTAKFRIEVTPRVIYPRGQRRRTVYDADGEVEGIAYSVTASTRKDAITQARADVEFCRRWSPLTSGGYTLKATRTKTFCLVFPHGGSYMFEAEDQASAIARLASEYHDHPEIPAFLAEVTTEETK